MVKKQGSTELGDTDRSVRVDRGTGVGFISESVSDHSARCQRQCEDGRQTVKARPVSKRKWGSAGPPREGGLYRQRRQTSENNWRPSPMGRGSERSGRDKGVQPRKEERVLEAGGLEKAPPSPQGLPSPARSGGGSGGGARCQRESRWSYSSDNN